MMRKLLFSTVLFSFLLTNLSFSGDIGDKIKFSAQIRPRLQLSNRDFNSATAMNTYSQLRTRVGVMFNTGDNLSAFVQIQDSRTFGSETSTLSNMSNIDLHQGYFVLDNFFKLPLSLKAGRFELLYGSQRLIGPVGWSNVGRSFDGGVLTVKTKPIDIDLVAARTNETMLPGDSSDVFVYNIYGKIKSFENYKLQPFLIIEEKIADSFSRYTLGFFASNINKGQGFYNELEGAYQFGSQNASQNISAYMITYNLKYTFAGKTKPAVGGGIDYLSGDDGKDADKYKVFNTLYATNHKFYGYMDYFLNIPINTYSLGLTDIHIKGDILPVNKLKLALAFHIFNAGADYTLTDNSTSKSFGNETDFTALYNYSDMVKLVGGFSFFTPGAIFKEKRGENTSTWTYLMAIVNF